MKSSETITLHKDVVRRIVVRNNTLNPRIFGSVVRGEDTEASDLDLLVEPISGKTTLFDLVRLKRELEETLQIKADVLTPASLHERYRNRIMEESLPL